MVIKFRIHLALSVIISSAILAMLSPLVAAADTGAGNASLDTAAQAWTTLSDMRSHVNKDSDPDHKLSKDEVDNLDVFNVATTCGAGKDNCHPDASMRDGWKKFLTSSPSPGVRAFFKALGYKQQDSGNDMKFVGGSVTDTAGYNAFLKANFWPKGAPFNGITTSPSAAVPNWIQYVTSLKTASSNTCVDDKPPFQQPFTGSEKGNRVWLVDSNLKVKEYVTTYKTEGAGCAYATKNLHNKDLATAYLNMLKQAGGNTDPVGSTNGGSSDQPSSCTVEGIGWIVCPVMNFMGHVVDATYSIVSDMLKVPPLSTKSSDPLFKAWATMRNFANIAFVIAFMIIIYSQITGAGVTNYGIKKLLPRIIIAAILVNVSYWICAIAVDLSNVVGSSVKDLFDNITNGLAPTSKDQTWWSSGAKSGGGQVAWTVGIAGVLALGTTALFGSLAILLPLLIGALVAVITVMIVLTARQAILILLIVIAPLAFVAFLLPNTDKWFKRWRETFFAMLFMFPIIAAIFGASKLAGVIIMNSGSNAVIQIMGAGVTIIPLIISPIVMKASTGILGKIGGFVNNPNKGPFDRMKKGAQGYADYRKDVNREKRVGRGANILKGTGKGLGGSNSRRRQALAYLGSGGANRAVDTERKRALAKGIADEKSQEYFAERALSDEGFAARIGGSDKKAEAVKASAQGAVDKIMQQDVANRKILYDADINIRNDPSKVLQDALKDGDEVGIRAAGSMYMEQGGSGFDKLREIVSQHQDTNPTDAKSVDAYRKFVADNGRDFIAKDANEIKWARGAYDEKDAQGNTTRRATLSEAAAAAGDIGRSDTQVAGLTKGSMLRGAQSGSISADQAKTILSNPQTAKEVDQDKQEILRAIIASGGPIQAQSNDELKAAVSNFARSAPTVADLQKAFTQSQPQPSTQPQTIEVVQGSGGGSTTAPQTDVQRNREAGGNFDGPR